MKEIVILAAGGVEYSKDEAACDIDDLIAALEEARDEGATHVVLPSGNYRGAMWQRLSPEWEWS